MTTKLFFSKHVALLLALHLTAVGLIFGQQSGYGQQASSLSKLAFQ